MNYSSKPCFTIDTTYFIDATQTKADIRWLYYALCWLRLDSFSKDSAVPGLAREDAYSRWLPYCELDEQRAIAAFLDRETARIDDLIAKKQRLIELLAEKRTALISHAVTKGLNPDAKTKDSGIEGVGSIPEHWHVLQLKQTLLARPGAIKTGPFGSQLLSSEMARGTVKVYNQRTVLDRDFDAGDNYITEEKYSQLAGFTVLPYDVLVTTRGTIGRCAIVPADAQPGILHPCVMRVQPDERIVLREYLSLLIQDSGFVTTQLMILSNATTIEVVYSDSLKQVRLPVPPVSEQRSILETVSRATERLECLLATVQIGLGYVQEYRSALISAAVTGKIDVRNEVA
ncbi:MAG: restriction endonuclease subunit S [Planctomycetes bacterium]|nr:restriction endonuclease subunit S [Planctomycetota bacterium]